MTVLRGDSGEIETQQLNIVATDRLPGFVAEIVDEFGTAIDLTGTKAYLSVRRVEGIPNQPPPQWSTPFEIVITNPVAGQVYYDWSHDDTSVNPGFFEVVVEIRAADGTVEFTAPTSADAFISVRDDPFAGQGRRTATVGNTRLTAAGNMRVRAKGAN